MQFDRAQFLQSSFVPPPPPPDADIARRAAIWDEAVRRAWVYDGKGESPTLPADTVAPVLKKYLVPGVFDSADDSSVGYFSDFIESRQLSGQALLGAAGHAVLQAADCFLDMEKVFGQWLRSQGQHETARLLERVFEQQVLPNLHGLDKLADANTLLAAAHAQESLARRMRRVRPQDMPTVFNRRLQAIPPTGSALFHREEFAALISDAGTRSAALTGALGRAWAAQGVPKGSQPQSALSRAEATPSRGRSGFGGTPAPQERTPVRSGRSRSRSRSPFRAGRGYSRSPSPNRSSGRRTPNYRQQYTPRRYYNNSNRNSNNNNNKRGRGTTTTTRSRVKSKVHFRAGRLRDFAHVWSAAGASKSTLVAVSGYRLPFISKPPLVLPSVCNPSLHTPPSKLMDDYVQQLLDLGAATKVFDNSPSFISPMFLVAKKGTEEKRPIFNVKPLNAFLTPPSFRMVNVSKFQHLVGPNDMLCSMDLVKGYWHIPVAECFRKYLRFIYRDVVYEFNCMPFGLNTAPFIFQQLTSFMCHLLRTRHNIRCVNYLDDLAFMNHHTAGLDHDLSLAIPMLESFGWLISEEKSELDPLSTF